MTYDTIKVETVYTDDHPVAPVEARAVVLFTSNGEDFVVYETRFTGDGWSNNFLVDSVWDFREEFISEVTASQLDTVADMK